MLALVVLGGGIAWWAKVRAEDRREAALTRAGALLAAGDPYGAFEAYGEALEDAGSEAAERSIRDARARALIQAAPALRAQGKAAEAAGRLQGCRSMGMTAWARDHQAGIGEPAPAPWPPAIDLSWELAISQAASGSDALAQATLQELVELLQQRRFAGAGRPFPDHFDRAPEIDEVLQRARPFLEGPASCERTLFVTFLSTIGPWSPLEAANVAWLDPARGWSARVAPALVEAVAKRPLSMGADLAAWRLSGVEGLAGELARVAGSAKATDRERVAAATWLGWVEDLPTAGHSWWSHDAAKQDALVEVALACHASLEGATREDARRALIAHVIEELVGREGGAEFESWLCAWTGEAGSAPKAKPVDRASRWLAWWAGQRGERLAPRLRAALGTANLSAVQERAELLRRLRFEKNADQHRIHACLTLGLEESQLPPPFVRGRSSDSASLAGAWSTLLGDSLGPDGPFELTFACFDFRDGRWPERADWTQRKPLAPGARADFERRQAGGSPQQRVAAAGTLPGIGGGHRAGTGSGATTTIDRVSVQVSSTEDGRTVLEPGYRSRSVESAGASSWISHGGSSPFDPLYVVVPSEGGDPRREPMSLWLGRATPPGAAPADTLDAWMAGVVADVASWAARFEACADEPARVTLYCRLQSTVMLGLGILQRVPVPDALPALRRLDQSFPEHSFLDFPRQRILAARIVAGDPSLLDDPGFEAACDALGSFAFQPNGDAAGFWAHAALVAADDRFRALALRRLEPLASRLEHDWRLPEFGRVALAAPARVPSWLAERARGADPLRAEIVGLLQQPVFAPLLLAVPLLLLASLLTLFWPAAMVARGIRVSAGLVAAAVIMLAFSVVIDGTDWFADPPAYALAAAGCLVLAPRKSGRAGWVPFAAFALAGVSDGLARLGVAPDAWFAISGFLTAIAITALPVLARLLRYGALPAGSHPLQELGVPLLTRAFVVAALCAWIVPMTPLCWIAWLGALAVCVLRTIRPGVATQGGRAVIPRAIPRLFALAYVYPLMAFDGASFLALIGRQNVTLRGDWLEAVIVAVAIAVLWALIRLGRAAYRPLGLRTA